MCLLFLCDDCGPLHLDGLSEDLGSDGVELVPLVLVDISFSWESQVALMKALWRARCLEGSKVWIGFNLRRLLALEWLFVRNLKGLKEGPDAERMTTWHSVHESYHLGIPLSILFIFLSLIEVRVGYSVEALVISLKGLIDEVRWFRPRISWA